MDAFDLGFMIGMQKQAKRGASGLIAKILGMTRAGSRGFAKNLGQVTRSKKGMDWFEALYHRMKAIRQAAGKGIASKARQGYRMKPRRAADIAQSYDQLAKHVAEKMKMPQHLQLEALRGVKPVGSQGTLDRWLNPSNFERISQTLTRKNPAKDFNARFGIMDPARYTSGKAFGKSYGGGAETAASRAAEASAREIAKRWKPKRESIFPVKKPPAPTQPSKPLIDYARENLSAGNELTPDAFAALKRLEEAQRAARNPGSLFPIPRRRS